ncbi:ion transporter [uncultured Bacteroides sp.]|uniref:ion transporter n=1 Tax=uncultured Bacteroides sp. TaxID=162156 RepID=UPI0025F14B57|nr:ion transporter [uncultured Bacteroides sp.]
MKLKERIHRFMHDEQLKRKLYVIIFESDTPAGKRFDVVLIGCILVSVLLVIIESLKGLPPYLTTPFVVLEYLFTAFFTFEYLTRIYCSPRPRKYVLSFFGIVDLLATLPLYIGLLFPGARYLLIIRTFRLIRVFRVFKLFHFLNEGERLLTALHESSKKIAVFFLFVVILVTSIGTLMYMIEGTQPDTEFNNIPNSIYWAIVTMTTVGYGDITPATGFGRFLSACVMLIGYTIIAVPTGIVSASMMKDYKQKQKKKCPHCHRSGHAENAAYCKYCGSRLSSSESAEGENNLQDSE